MDKRKYNRVAEDKQQLQQFAGDVCDNLENIPTEEQVTQIAKAAIQADKDIISQIKMEYDEEDNITKFYFPKEILILAIELNTHILYFKDGIAVDYSGSTVEGYELDDIVTTGDNPYLAFVGDLSEQIINSLVYINYQNSTLGQIQNNSYNLFFPQSNEVEAYEGTSLLPTNIIFSGWTLHRAIKDGNILWLVLAGTIENNSGVASSISTMFELSLPSYISSKIYRLDGTKVSENYSTENIITVACGTVNSAYKNYNVYSIEINKIIVNIPASQISETGKMRVEMRLPLFLDIGE